MRALLDVNVLLAMHDASHTHHQTARSWYAQHRDAGWASCPITQNGFVRILSQPRYPANITTAAAIELLASSCASDDHQFWPDDVSILDPELVAPQRILGPRRLTDVHLLSLAVRHGGRLVTFDSSIPTSAVPSAEREQLTVIG